MAENSHLLVAALECGRHLVVHARTAQGFREVPAQLLSGSAGESGFWAQLSGADAELVDRLIAARMPVKCTVNDGQTQVAFETVLRQRRRPLLRGDRVLLQWPGKIRVAERRRSPREPVPERPPITARLSRSGKEPWTLAVCDLSAGGASFICPETVRLPELQPGEPLSVMLEVNGSEYRFDLLYRRRQPHQDGVLVGAEFDVARCPPQSLQWLRGFLGELQAVRIRCSLASSLGRPAA